MATEYIYKECSLCNGDGEVYDPSSEGSDVIPCLKCINSSGKVFWGWLQDEKESEE